MDGSPPTSEAATSGAVDAPDEAAAVQTKSWFALWTRSRHEQAVCGELEALHVDTFLPTIKRVSRWKDRRKVIAWPLFPGYCFARLECGDLTPARRCKGVVTVLSNGGRPVRIPDMEIEALERLMASGLPFEPTPAIAMGTLVEVVSGPLTGVCGRLVDQRRREQLLLTIEVLRAGVRVEVSAWDVRPV